MSFWKFNGKYAGISKKGDRFVVNTRKEAVKKAGKTKVKKTSTKKKSVKKTKKRSVKRKVAKKKRRRNGFGVQSLFKWFRLGSFLAPAAARMMTTAPNATKIAWIVGDYTGYDMAAKKFVPQNLARGWMPFIMTNIVTYGVGKLNGIIRRL